MAGRMDPVVGREQVPALVEANDTAERLLMLPTDTGAPAGNLDGALEVGHTR